jgi:hypothetical protein
MYRRHNRKTANIDLGFDDYLASLAARHANFEKAIQDETRRPAPDCLWLSNLKRRKLRVKEEIEHLRRVETTERRASQA